MKKKILLFLFSFILFTSQVNAAKTCDEYEVSNCPVKSSEGKICYQTSNTCKDAYCEDYPDLGCPEEVNGMTCEVKDDKCVTTVDSEGNAVDTSESKTCYDYEADECPKKVGSNECEVKNNSCMPVDVTGSSTTKKEDNSSKDPNEGKIKAITCTGNTKDQIPETLPMYVRALFNILKLLIPIIIIALGMLDFFKATTSSEEKDMDEQKNKFTRRLIAGVAIFFVLAIVQWVFGRVGSKDNFMGCVSCFLTSASDCKEAGYIDPGANDRKNKTPSKTPNPETTNRVVLEDDWEIDEISTSKSKGDGGILIIAGHSYYPYCAQVSNECREESGYKYLEPDQTRILAKLLKKELDNLNLKASIANEMLGGTDAKMNKSMYVENVLKTQTFKNNEKKFKKFTHVIEIHFNASDSHTAQGTLLMLGTKGMSSIDKELKEAVVKYTGKSMGNITQSLKNVNYFESLNIPITYIETEFYDNTAAMNKYNKNKEKIAKELANVFKKHYGSKIARSTTDSSSSNSSTSSSSSSSSSSSNSSSSNSNSNSNSNNNYGVHENLEKKSSSDICKLYKTYSDCTNIFKGQQGCEWHGGKCTRKDKWYCYYFSSTGYCPVGEKDASGKKCKIVKGKGEFYEFCRNS